MARLVGHLLREAAQLADVVQHYRDAIDVAVRPADRRGRRLDTELAAARARDEDRSPPEVDARAGREALLYRVRERAAVVLVDEADHRAERLAGGLLAPHARERFGRLVHVVDEPVRIGRQDALAERLERELRARGRQPHGRRLAMRQHFLGREQRELAPSHLDRGARELDARDLAMRVRDLELGEGRLRLAGERARYRKCGKLGVFAGYDVRQRLSRKLGGRYADDRDECLVGRLDTLAVEYRRLTERRKHRAHGVVARLRGARRRVGFPQTQEPLPQSPGGGRTHGGRDRQRDGDDRRDRHRAFIPFESAARGTVNIRYIARPFGSISHACTDAPGDSP
jgi:hypothetical protein